VTKRLLILTLAALGVFGAAELALRVFFPADAGPMYALDPELLHRLVPGAQKVFEHHPANDGRRIHVHVNSSGFRGEELSESEDQLRVVVFGDSFVMAEFTERQDTFSEKLESALEARSQTRVEVVNAGVAAYGPDQSLRRMEIELSRLMPNLVVFCLLADNDYGDLLRNKMFALEADGELRPLAFKISGELQERFSGGLSSSAVVRLIRRARSSRRAQGVVPPVDRAERDRIAIETIESFAPICAEEYASAVLHKDLTVRALFSDHYDVDLATEPESEAARYKAALMGAVIRRVCSVAAGHPVPILFIVIPSATDLCDSSRGLLVSRKAHPRYDPRRLSQIMERQVAESGAPCISLFEHFTEANPGSFYFLPPENHWNEAGQALAAQVAADAVRELDLLPDIEK
jgi:hypothetical protein